MKKQIVKEFITVKKVRYLPRDPLPESEPPPPPKRIVLVVGRVTLDMISVCDRHPTPGLVERTTDGWWQRGGKASNICTVLRRLGTDCQFLGRLCSTPAFESLLNGFQAMAIDISSCPRSPHQPAQRSIIQVRDHNTRTILEYATQHHELSFQQFLGAVDYQKYAWIHFEARNAKETLKMMRAVRDYNERSGQERIIISVDLYDLKPMNLLMGDLADYIFVCKQLKRVYAYMNGRETVWAVREHLIKAYSRWQTTQPKKTPYLEDEKLRSAQADNCLVQPPRQPTIIYNNYKEGASCLRPDDTFFKVGGHKAQKRVDVIGENDTFCAAVIYALHQVKLSLRDALEYGTRAVVLKRSFNGFDDMRCMPKDLVSCYYA